MGVGEVVLAVVVVVVLVESELRDWDFVCIWLWV
jgi:hypothetical protein